MAVLLAGITSAEGISTRASVSPSGIQGVRESEFVAVSADGRYLVFRSEATNFASGIVYGTSNVYVRDRLEETTACVSVDPAGAPGNASSGNGVAISADGRFVAFESKASDLVSGDSNGFGDVFVRDMQLEETTLASVSSTGIQGDRASGGFPLSISDDGRYVAFRSKATNFATGDTAWDLDVFRHDRQTGQTLWASSGLLGIEGDGESGEWGSCMSGDGRYMAFASSSTNLVVRDTNGLWDIFVRDCQTGQLVRVSVDSAGGESDGTSWLPSVATWPSRAPRTTWCRGTCTASPTSSYTSS